MFLNWWSHTAHGFAENLSPTDPLPPRFDCASVFPPKEMTQNKPHKRFIEYSGPNQDAAIRCFSIDSKSVERLKQVGIGQSTRVEAVSALVWRRCIKRTQGDNIVSMSHAVNIRSEWLRYYHTSHLGTCGCCSM
ncbi:vinorine synthase-like protein [Carex littledalei]|uniref:Vinorine synthase-like protein n=1 Tax=Carex littledalei TaxID=544730 RepID=A0A833RKG6_9POAL|nr:vinorine synthase-like protein [Carex littledalei]